MNVGAEIIKTNKKGVGGNNNPGVTGRYLKTGSLIVPRFSRLMAVTRSA